MKTAIQMAKEECACYRPKRCIMTDKRCPVLDDGKCEVSAQWWPGAQARNPNVSYLDACVKARHIRARTCECGVMLERGRRQCDSCTRKRARNRARKHRSEKRGLGVTG